MNWCHFWSQKISRFAVSPSGRSMPALSRSVSTTRGSTDTTRHPACRSSACRSARRTATVSWLGRSQLPATEQWGMAPSPGGRDGLQHVPIVFFSRNPGNSIVGALPSAESFSFRGFIYCRWNPPQKKKQKTVRKPSESRKCMDPEIDPGLPNVGHMYCCT